MEKQAPVILKRNEEEGKQRATPVILKRTAFHETEENDLISCDSFCTFIQLPWYCLTKQKFLPFVTDNLSSTNMEYGTVATFNYACQPLSIKQKSMDQISLSGMFDERLLILSLFYSRNLNRKKRLLSLDLLLCHCDLFLFDGRDEEMCMDVMERISGNQKYPAKIVCVGGLLDHPKVITLPIIENKFQLYRMIIEKFRKNVCEKKWAENIIHQLEARK